MKQWIKGKNARLRSPAPDGSNEIIGITPDLIVPWRPNDSPYQRAKRIVETLEKFY